MTKDIKNKQIVQNFTKRVTDELVYRKSEKLGIVLSSALLWWRLFNIKRFIYFGELVLLGINVKAALEKTKDLTDGEIAYILAASFMWKNTLR